MPVMQENLGWSDFHNVEKRQIATSRRVIGVPLDGGNRRNRFELPQNGIGANVPGMEDVVHVLKDIKNSRSQKAVGVGDDADFERRTEIFHHEAGVRRLGVVGIFFRRDIAFGIFFTETAIGKDIARGTNAGKFRMETLADKTDEVGRERGKRLVERQSRRTGIVGFRVISSRCGIEAGFFGRIILRKRCFVGERFPRGGIAAFLGKRVESFAGGGKTQAVALARFLKC